MSNITFETVDSLSGIKPEDWNPLADENPISSHEFLATLEETQNVGNNSGWDPIHIIARDNGTLVGAMPLYLKSHSYGEYIFDWAWADAYQRSGLSYYPKLLCAIPFTPTTGPRLLSTSTEIKKHLVRSAISIAKENKLSSFHCLLPSNEDRSALSQESCLGRKSIQFHWRNHNYDSFDHYLSTMRSQKRKKIRQERQRIQSAGISFRVISGQELSDQDLDFFYSCYEHTYLIRGSTPYLNIEFFYELRRKMGQSLLFVLAIQDQTRLAGALNIVNGQTIWGRYWGARHHIPGLHFETCYYQAIEFAIKEQYRTFEGGAQGEHKLSRGLEAVETYSAHWLAHPQFAEAIENFLARETNALDEYQNDLDNRAPFKTL